VDTQAAKEKDKKSVPKLDDFLQARDYTGAITLLEVIITLALHMASSCFMLGMLGSLSI
jgi:uncharacterized membrane protein YwzB